MRKSIFNIIFLFSMALWGSMVGGISCWQDTESNEQSLTVSPEELEIPSGSNDVRILKRTGYTLSYNDRMKIPNWVAWELTAEEASGRIKRADEFREDTELPARVRSENRDFSDPRYDRGHMAPAGDMKWSLQSMEESFLLSNMCPQASQLNRGCWRILEESCRKWAKQYGRLYIVCGPIVSDDGKHQQIGKGKVYVPDGFFKVILYKTTEYHAIGFVFPNDDCHLPVKDYAVSVDKVEQLTDIDFFHHLPDDIEKEVESTSDLAGLKINAK